MRVRTGVLVVAVAVIAAAIGRWSAPGNERSVANAERSQIELVDPDAQPAARPAVAARDAPTKPNPSATAAVAAGVSPTRLALDVDAYFAALPARLDGIAEHARNGDGHALVELAEWLDYCSMAAQTGEAGRRGRAPRGDLGDADVVAYFQKTTVFCEQWLQRHPWLVALRDAVAMDRLREAATAGANAADRARRRSPINAAEALRRRAADAGDPVAQQAGHDPRLREACGEANSSGAESQAQRFAVYRCLHAQLRTRLAALLAQRDPQVLEAMPKIVFAYDAFLVNGSPYFNVQTASDNATEVLWILTACQFGLNCGPSGRALRWACALGACGYAHYHDYASDQLLAPGSMRYVDALVPQLTALIWAGNVDAILGPPPGG